jgi:hypothetical protein
MVQMDATVPTKHADWRGGEEWHPQAQQAGAADRFQDELQGHRLSDMAKFVSADAPSVMPKGLMETPPVGERSIGNPNAPVTVSSMVH